MSKCQRNEDCGFLITELFIWFGLKYLLTYLDRLSPWCCCILALGGTVFACTTTGSFALRYRELARNTSKVLAATSRGPLTLRSVRAPDPEIPDT